MPGRQEPRGALSSKAQTTLWALPWQQLCEETAPIAIRAPRQVDVTLDVQPFVFLAELDICVGCSTKSSASYFFKDLEVDTIPGFESRLQQVVCKYGQHTHTHRVAASSNIQLMGPCTRQTADPEVVITWKAELCVSGLILDGAVYGCLCTRNSAIRKPNPPRKRYASLEEG